MIQPSAKCREALFAASTAEEVAAALAADGIEATTEEAESLLAEIKAHPEAADAELSAEELAAVAGGYDRDWLRDGCVATSGFGGCPCWSNDWCEWLSVTYDNKPWAPCEECGGRTIKLNHKYYKCLKCGYVGRIGQTVNSQNVGPIGSY